ncbi:hypothetical protein CcaCcLH18_13605 [Colletotrichum camelliae]|nr:hypothetical protein CcaCcLH18_13605 [Colletotrichum camelliae]
MGDEDTQQLHKTTVKERFIQFLPAPIRPALEATLEMAENITGVTSSGFSDIACSRRAAEADAYLADFLVGATEEGHSELAGYDQFFAISGPSASESCHETSAAHNTSARTPASSAVRRYYSVTWSIRSREEHITKTMVDRTERFTRFIFHPASVRITRTPADGIIEHGVPQAETSLYGGIDVDLQGRWVITEDKVLRVSRFLRTLASGCDVECLTRDTSVVGEEELGDEA